MCTSNTNTVVKLPLSNTIPNNYTYDNIAHHQIATITITERDITVPPVITATDSSMNNTESSVSDNIQAHMIATIARLSSEIEIL